MSKYDDVQQFKDKVNLKDVDYKEFSKVDTVSTHRRWSIVEQVAGSGDSTFVGPQLSPINTADFSSTTSLGLEQSSQPISSIKEKTRLPGHISHNFEHIVSPVGPNLGNSRNNAFQEVPVHSEAELTAVSQGNSKRFKQLFSKKASATDEVETSDRNTLLKPLLESIASCR